MAGILRYRLLGCHQSQPSIERLIPTRFSDAPGESGPGAVGLWNQCRSQRHEAEHDDSGKDVDRTHRCLQDIRDAFLLRVRCPRKRIGCGRVQIFVRSGCARRGPP